MPFWSKKPPPGSGNGGNGQDDNKCRACRGAGRIPLTDEDDGTTVYYDCSTCSGSGKKK